MTYRQLLQFFVLGFFFFSAKLLVAQNSHLSTVSLDSQELQLHPLDHSLTVPWGPDGVTVGATSIIDGKGNTISIINEYGNWNQGNYAANVCAQLDAFGYSDWYLPSTTELAHIWGKRDEIGGFSAMASYWTSTEDYWGTEAAALDFSSGIIIERYKDELHRVRCVRRVSMNSDLAASHNGEFIAVARYRINDRGEAGLVFASSLLGVFNAASFANSIAQFAGEVIKSEIKKSAIKYIISSASDDKPAPAYITILFPIRGENKPIEPEDIVFVQEYAGGNLLPLGYPISLTYRMVDENESSPVLVIANNYDLFPLDNGAYDYLPVDLASRGNQTTLASDKTFQTFGVVSKYKEYLGKTMLILKQYEHYNYGFASGTGLNFLAIKVSDHSQDVPAPGSVIKINGTTKNLREIGQGWRIRIEETPWYNVKSAKYVEAHTMQVVSGSRMPKADIVYDESIFSFYYDSNVYQAVVVDLSKASKQGIKGDDGSDEGTFTDPRDGKTYRWVRIGDQVWMAENLNYTTGTSNTFTDDAWGGSNMRNGVACYENNPKNCEKYGHLYNYDAARSACPPDWHLPSKEDVLRVIEHYKKFHSVDELSESDWNFLNGLGTQLAGSHGYFGGFSGIESSASFWTSNAEKFGFAPSDSDVTTFYNPQSTEIIEGWGSLGFSVRCVKPSQAIRDNLSGGFYGVINFELEGGREKIVSQIIGDHWIELKFNPSVGNYHEFNLYFNGVYYNLYAVQHGMGSNHTSWLYERGKWVIPVKNTNLYHMVPAIITFSKTRETTNGMVISAEVKSNPDYTYDFDVNDYLGVYYAPHSGEQYTFYRRGNELYVQSSRSNSPYFKSGKLEEVGYRQYVRTWTSAMGRSSTLFTFNTQFGGSKTVNVIGDLIDYSSQGYLLHKR